LIASLFLTARRKGETAICEATPGAWTIARVKARTKPVPAIVPIAVPTANPETAVQSTFTGIVGSPILSGQRLRHPIFSDGA